VTVVLSGLGSEVERHAGALAAAPERLLRAEEARLDTLAAQIRALDPERVLARGFSITRTADGRVARRAATLAAGHRVVTRLAAGSFTAVVDRSGDTDEDGEAS
jgi:exodeoxyribonuclease VII large subunit